MPRLTQLATMDPDGWSAMQHLGEIRQYVAGHHVFSDREEASHVYIVHAGLIEILKESGPESELRLALLDEGELFGEGALWENTQRSATARAFKDSEVLVIPAMELQDFLDRHPDFALRMYRLLCVRYHHIIGDLDSDLKVLHTRLLSRDAH